jgi:hypothetical protein
LLTQVAAVVELTMFKAVQEVLAEVVLAPMVLVMVALELLTKAAAVVVVTQQPLVAQVAQEL